MEQRLREIEAIVDGLDDVSRKKLADNRKRPFLRQL